MTTTPTTTPTATTYTKFPVHLGNLSGPGGNAFAVLAQVNRSYRQCEQARVPNLPPLQLVLDEMKSGDYAHLLDTVNKFCDDLDGSIDMLADATFDNGDLDSEEDY